MMADGVGSKKSLLSFLSPIQDSISEYNCVKCSAYEYQLNQVMDELKSPKEIIDILQQELYNTVPSKSEHESNYSQRKETTMQTNSTEWITVSAKYTSAKPSRSNQSASSTIKQNIESWNKYTLLHNLRDSSAVLNDLQSYSDQKGGQL